MFGKSDFDIIDTTQNETRIESQLKVLITYVSPGVVIGAVTGW